MDVRLRALAVADIDAAVAHYTDEAGQPVAIGFVDALQSAITVLSDQPQIGSLRFAYELGIPELRYWRLETFPYLVFYVPRAEHIDVWRVLHARRDIPALLADDDRPEEPPG